MSGKGDNPRPFSVTPEEYGANWDRIFGSQARKAREFADVMLGPAAIAFAIAHTDFPDQSPEGQNP